MRTRQLIIIKTKNCVNALLIKTFLSHYNEWIYGEIMTRMKNLLMVTIVSKTLLSKTLLPHSWGRFQKTLSSCKPVVRCKKNLLKISWRRLLMIVHPKNDLYTSKSKLTMVNNHILSDGLILVQHSAMDEENAVKCECVKFSLHQSHGEHYKGTSPEK